MKADGVHCGHFDMVVAFSGTGLDSFVHRHEYHSTNDAGLIEVSQHPVRKMIEFEQDKTEKSLQVTQEELNIPL